jgi:hypothetical protein
VTLANDARLCILPPELRGFGQNGGLAAV